MFDLPLLKTWILRGFEMIGRLTMNCQMMQNFFQSTGNPAMAYEFIYREGISPEDCQPYEAVDGECSDMGKCENCVPGDTPENFLPGTCSAVEKYPKYYIKEFGELHGAEQMKAEIFMRGPISCGIEATEKLIEYSGGVYSEQNWFPMINHEG